MIVRTEPEQVVLRDGGGWPWFVAGLLLGIGLPLVVRWSSGTTLVVGLGLVIAGGWLLRSSPRIVSVFDARISTAVVARRPVIGRRVQVRLPLADVGGVEVVSGRLLLVGDQGASSVALSTPWATRPKVARAQAEVSSFLLRAARPS